MTEEDIAMQDTDQVMEAKLERVTEILEEEPENAIRQLREFLKGRKQTDELSFYQERAIQELIKAYVVTKDADGLIALLNEVRKSFDYISKSKRENIVKNVLDKLSLIPGTDDKQIALCNEYIEFLNKDKRDFLRQRFESKLSGLLIKKGKYKDALTILSRLSTEVKKVDDKLLLVEIYLNESKVQFALDNISKARSSLTAAKTNSNTVYINIDLQSEIDLQAGVINAHERDFRTSYSYFFEAHEGFSQIGNKENSKVCLEYMVLSKIMNDKAYEVNHILNFKHSVPFLSERSLVILKEIADTVKEKSLEKFSKVMSRQEVIEMFGRNKLMGKSLKELEDTLLEKNLVKVILPYSRVEVQRVAELMTLEEDKVMSKLSQMILDKKFRGIIDQGVGELIIHPEPVSDETYQDSLQLIEHMGSVVNNLVRRAKAHLQAQ